MENVIVQKVDFATQCRVDRMSDLVWLTFDPCCSSLVYGLMVNEVENEFSVVKYNLRINHVTVCKTFALVVDGGDEKRVKIRFTNAFCLNLNTSDSLAIYFGVQKNDRFYAKFLLVDFLTSFHNLYEYYAEQNAGNYLNKLEDAKSIASYKLTHSLTQSWCLGLIFRIRKSDDRKFHLNTIVFNAYSRTFSCRRIFEDADNGGFNGETPSNYFLIDDTLYFTFFNAAHVLVFNLADKCWLNKIETPASFRVCRSIDLTRSGLIFVFNGRQPFYRLIIKQMANSSAGDLIAGASSWQQLSFALPTHEALVRVIIDWNENVLVCLPFAQRLELFYGCLNCNDSDNVSIFPTPISSLRNLAFNKFMQKFTVQQQKHEQCFVRHLGLPNNLIRFYFGPSWMFTDKTTEIIKI